MSLKGAEVGHLNECHHRQQHSMFGRKFGLGLGPRPGFCISFMCDHGYVTSLFQCSHLEGSITSIRFIDIYRGLPGVHCCPAVGVMAMDQT